MSAAEIAAGAGRGSGARKQATDLVAVTVLAALAACLRIGASSYSADEVASLQIASSSLRHVLDQLRLHERAPAIYYWLLHEWSYRLHTQGEWQIRLLSAFAGIALVWLVWRLGVLAGGRTVGLLAAALAALSPLVITCEQLARPYTLAMLLVCATALCALEARRRRSQRLLAACSICALASVSVHYSAWFVVLALIAWVATAPEFSRTARVAFGGVTVWYGGLWIALAAGQLDHEPTSWHAGATGLQVVRVLGAPFDGRAPVGFSAARVTAVLALVLGLGLLARQRSTTRGVRSLLLACAAAPVVSVFVIALAGTNLLAARNVAVGAPFALVALAIAIVKARRPLALALAALVGVSTAWALVAMEQDSGGWPDARGAMRFIAARQRPCDVVLYPPDPALSAPLRYYAAGRLQRGVALVAADQNAAAATRASQRVWVITAGAAAKRPPRAAPPAVAAYFPGTSPLRVALVSSPRPSCHQPTSRQPPSL